MPFRAAWLYVLVLLALTFVAFWPSYLSQLPSALVAHHAHAASAVLWTILAALQAWSIHHGRIAMHRTAGLAVFALFPFFLVAGMWVIHVEATTLSRGVTDPANLALAQFGFFDPLANLGYAILFWGGLAHRRNVQLHARYMLGTVMFVIAPVLWRLLSGYVPGFGENELPFDYPFALGNLGALAIVIALYWHSPKLGRPFLIVAAFIAAQAILFLTIGKQPGWAPIFASLSAVNLPVLLVLTAVISLAVSWHGWQSGAIPAPRRTAQT